MTRMAFDHQGLKSRRRIITAPWNILMNSLPFQIAVDLPKRMIIARMLGFCDLHFARAFVAEMSVASKAMLATGPHFDMLLDIGKAPPLPRDATAYLEQEHVSKRHPQVRKMAFVCHSALGRLQIRRMTFWDKGTKVFAHEDDALKWFALAVDS